MELNLYIYSGLGNIIALVDLVREDLCISSKEVVKIAESEGVEFDQLISILPPESPCLLYTSPSPRDVEESRMPSSA